MKKLRTDELVVNRAAVRIPREIHERIMEDPAWRHLMDTKLLVPRRAEQDTEAPASRVAGESD